MVVTSAIGRTYPALLCKPCSLTTTSPSFAHRPFLTRSKPSAAALKQGATEASLILTTGGTGLSARDVTPEATLQVCDRLINGLSETMRREGALQTPLAALSRGLCGTIPTQHNPALVINLPRKSNRSNNLSLRNPRHPASRSRSARRI